MRNHILAFSSDRNMLHTLEFLLEAEQFRVTTASFWTEVPELLKRTECPFHLMILDTDGSGGNGLELLSGSSARKRDIPIIVLTGSLRGQKKRNTPEENHVAWMEKPVNRETLLHTIAALLREAPDQDNR